MKDDLEIVHVGQWTLQALLADRMTANNIFLAGDTAHTFTPAGGFGMNCGFQDINHLVHILHTIIRNQKANRTMLAADYDRERRRVNGLYRDKSLKNYRITEKVAAELGFPANLTLQYFKISKLIPFDLGGSAQLEKIRLIAMKILYQRAAIESPLQLFFDDFDFQTQCHSALQE